MNEQGGHALGDRALQEGTACLQASCRPDDGVARLGGDEFAVLLPGLGPAQVGSVAERIRSACETSSQLPLPLTVSLGSAIYPTHGTTAAGVLEAADRALFAAKRTGKNRSTMYRTAPGDGARSKRVDRAQGL
jgi:two-component system cell cycle response regulator